MFKQQMIKEEFFKLIKVRIEKLVSEVGKNLKILVYFDFFAVSLVGWPTWKLLSLKPELGKLSNSHKKMFYFDFWDEVFYVETSTRTKKKCQEVANMMKQYRKAGSQKTVKLSRGIRHAWRSVFLESDISKCPKLWNIYPILPF